MKIKFKQLIVAALLVMTVALASSCKKQEVKKVAVDTRLAVALFSDTIAFREIINDMDSTTKAWLRVRNDSIFAFYVDTIKEVLKASDLLDDIDDVSSNTTTSFSLPPYDPTNNHDTIMVVDRFLTVPFHYVGYNIKEVLLRSGLLSLGFHVTPTIDHLQKIEVYSRQIQTPEGDTLVITVDSDNAERDIDLSRYVIIPENDTVALSAKVYIHVDNGVYEGGQYETSLHYSLEGINFHEIFGTIDLPFETVYNDQTDIDFGIKGLTGSAIIKMPTIKLDYCNTFGLSATANVTKLQFVNTNTSLVTNLLAQDTVTITVNKTEGAWANQQIVGFTDNIDAMAGYTRLDFGGVVDMGLNDHDFYINENSAVDVAADVELPFSLNLKNLCYNDTISIDMSDADDAADQIDDYIDEIEFFIDYNNKIKINIDMQAIFIKGNAVLDSLFDDTHEILYSDGDEISTISVRVTGDKLKNVLRANQMIVRLATSTVGNDLITLKASDAIFLRMRFLTKTTEIDLN